MPAYLPLITSAASLLTAIVVVVLGFVMNRRMDRHRRDHAYNRYKLEQIQKSLDEMLRPRPEPLIELTFKDRKKYIGYFYSYADDIDYYWERASHYCTHAPEEKIVETNNLKKTWRVVMSEVVMLDQNATEEFWRANIQMVQDMVNTCHAYKKAAVSILIFEAKAHVQNDL